MGFEIALKSQDLTSSAWSADFTYDEATDRYRCPADQWLYPRGYNPRRQHTEYKTRKHVCVTCPLRARCTDAKDGRVVQRYREHELVLRARAQARSHEARRDYRRRRHLMEGSFAQSANCHGFKRARWRRLWRQQIQDWLIAACQNVKLLIRTPRPAPRATSQGQIVPETRGKALPVIMARLRAVFDAPYQSSPAPIG